ncbi:hypothetical protein CBR_g34893 [Chara braunii]|uniref:Uncharacterized protein n=1 Tax=Chara braunii TaxID=69332 RepID=A0A388LJL8_CHABU|nr:hypothetical protein CBR_g34893 [Chara braunii]|eukprot:GBG82516.1 hypothetical protein CBR_g34893 [Chara braunii]
MGLGKRREEAGQRSHLVGDIRISHLVQSMDVREATIAIGKGGEVVGVEGTKSGQEGREKLLMVIAGGDCPCNQALYFNIIEVSPCHAEEENVKAEEGDEGLCNGVGENVTDKAGSVVLMEQGGGERVPSIRKWWVVFDSAEGEVVKGTAG